MNPKVTRGSRSASGVTLLELLVAFFIISILISLIVMGIHSAKSTAGHSRVLADLRTLAIGVSDYAMKNNDDFISPAISGSVIDRSYFSFTESWRLYWGGAYFDMDFRYPPMTRIVRTSENNVPYFLAPSVFSTPEYWREYSTRDMSMLKAPRVTSVRFPSSKSLFISPHDDGGVSLIPIINRGPPFFKPSFLLGMSMVDGSADFVSERELLLPDMRGEGNYEWSYWPTAMYGMHTRDGVYGRDRD